VLDRKLSGPEIRSGFCGKINFLAPCRELNADSSVVEPLLVVTIPTKLPGFNAAANILTVIGSTVSTNSCR
jgi:hypothetical protein